MRARSRGPRAPLRLGAVVLAALACLAVPCATGSGGPTGLLGSPASAATTPPPTPAFTPAPRTALPCEVRAPTASAVGGERLSRTGVQTALPAGRAAPPRLAASSWVVVDLTTADVVAACNAHARLRPASTLKLLTALSLVERLAPTGRYTATAADTAVDGSKVGLSAGSTYSVVDLLHGMLLPSGNDAAHAFGELSGGVAAATGLMNAEAARLGATDTLAVNTSGLDADGQLTSAYDLALFGREALRRPWLRTVMTTRTYAFPGKGTATDASRPRYQIQNGNRLLADYTGTIGGKNGITTGAGGTIMAAATRGGRTYLVTVMHAGGAVSPMAEALLDWAFANAAGAQPVGTLVDPLPAGPVPVQTPTATPLETDPSTGLPTDVPGDGATGPASPTPSGSVRPTATATTIAATPASSDVPRLVAVGYIAVAVVVGLGLGLARVRAKNRADRRADRRAQARARAARAGDVSAGRRGRTERRR